MEEVTSRKTKTPFLKVQVPLLLFAPSPSLPASVSHIHVRCTLGKLQSFAQAKEQLFLLTVQYKASN